MMPNMPRSYAIPVDTENKFEKPLSAGFHSSRQDMQDAILHVFSADVTQHIHDCIFRSHRFCVLPIAPSQCLVQWTMNGWITSSLSPLKSLSSSSGCVLIHLPTHLLLLLRYLLQAPLLWDIPCRLWLLQRLHGCFPLRHRRLVFRCHLFRLLFNKPVIYPHASFITVTFFFALH